MYKTNRKLTLFLIGINFSFASKDIKSDEIKSIIASAEKRINSKVKIVASATEVQQGTHAQITFANGKFYYSDATRKNDPVITIFDKIENNPSKNKPVKLNFQQGKSFLFKTDSMSAESKDGKIRGSKKIVGVNMTRDFPYDMISFVKNLMSDKFEVNKFYHYIFQNPTNKNFVVIFFSRPIQEQLAHKNFTAFYLNENKCIQYILICIEGNFYILKYKEPLKVTDGK
jgi:hypothetical protein